jgi:sterol desaturase/sphingolipid hydroxylase (fatty acid hydroxylase superfamily)
VETSGYYALGIPLYALLMLGEHAWAKRRGLSVYRVADDLGNLACGMGQILAGLFLGPLMLRLYAFGFELRAFSLPRGPLTWALSLVLVDLCYYFYHRAGHRVRVLWAVHGVHHQSDGFNFAVALRQPYISDLYAIFFYFPLPLLGVPVDVFFASVALLSLNQITLHTRLLPRPSLFLFNTPALHELHHACNAPYAGKNFGATLILWDRLFGTYAAPDPGVPPVLGTEEGYATHDSVRSQWLGVATIIADLRAASSPREVWERIFGHPPAHRAKAPRARDSGTIPLRRKIGALALFVLLTAAAAAFLVLQSRLPTAGLAAGTFLLLFGYHRIGRALDGPARSENAATR